MNLSEKSFDEIKILIRDELNRGETDVVINNCTSKEGEWYYNCGLALKNKNKKKAKKCFQTAWEIYDCAGDSGGMRKAQAQLDQLG